MPETKIATKVRKYIREELRGIYTVSFVVVEQVNYDDMEVKVSLKRDKEGVFTVPIASLFAQGSGHGLIVPIKPDDEGLLLHTKTPIDDLTVEKGHVEPFEPKRIFDINDALFLPMFWNDNDTKPPANFSNFEDGDWLLSHPSGTVFQIKGENHGSDAGTVYFETGTQGVSAELNDNTGGFTVADKDGNTVEADGQGNLDFVFSGDVTVQANKVVADSSTIELGSGTLAKVLNANATIEYEDTGDTSDGSAGTTTKTATISDAGTSNVDAS